MATKIIKILFTVLICMFCLDFIFLKLFFNKHSVPQQAINVKEDLPVVLWWTPFTGVENIIKKCNYGLCHFTQDRDYFNFGNNLKAILFYGSDFKVEDLPIPRKSLHWWGLLHEESPKNQPLFDHEPALSLFNLTSTFKSESGMPLTLQYLESIDSLISKTDFVSTPEKNHILKEKNLSPILYLQSDCNPPSQRDEYITEILKYIGVDSYGLCLNNKELPPHLRGIDSMNHVEILKLLAKYKFTIAFENAACDDYITEKLWRPLKVGTVPIYWGSPSVHNWLPNNKSIVHVRDFKSPHDLALHILNILANDTIYEEHLEHKLSGVIRNRKLVETLKQRSWGINEEQMIKGNFVEAFECFICDSVLNLYNNSRPGSLIAQKSHYGCPVPETVLPSPIEKAKGFWVEQWFKAEAEAEVLFDLIHESHMFTMNTFYERVISVLQNKNYFTRFSQVEL